MAQTRVLDPHVQPGKQRPLPLLPIHSIDKGPPTPPIPKPRIGQGIHTITPMPTGRSYKHHTTDRP